MSFIYEITRTASHSSSYRVYYRWILHNRYLRYISPKWICARPALASKFSRETQNLRIILAQTFDRDNTLHYGDKKSTTRLFWPRVWLWWWHYTLRGDDAWNLQVHHLRRETIKRVRERQREKRRERKLRTMTVKWTMKSIPKSISTTPRTINSLSLFIRPPNLFGIVKR